MRTFVIAMFAAASLVAVPVAVDAAPCKDAKGKFVKCPPKAAATTPAKATPAKAAAAKPAAKPATGKKAPCRDAKGRFAKCK